MTDTKKSIQKTIKVDPTYNTFFDQVSAQLSANRLISLRGDVNENMLGHLSHSINYLVSQSKKPINIDLTTLGGSVSDGLGIYDKIIQARRQGVEVNITVFGYCMSMGVTILQAATKRLSGENTSFLLHEVAYGGGGSHSANKDRVTSIEKLNTRLSKIITDRSNLTTDELAKLTERRDYTISADEALQHGLIDTII